MLKAGEQWTLVSKDGTHLVLIKHMDSGAIRSPSEEEAHRAVSYLNDQGSYTVTLYCRTANCKDKGSWIRRGVDDAKKNVYTCEVCHQPMVR